MASAQRILRFLAGRFRDTQSDGKVYALQNGTLLDVTSVTQKALATVPLTVTSAGQTVFSVPGGYTPGLLQVARNGILQSFTGTDGSIITLSSGTVSTSDTVTAYVFATFQVANALMLSGGTMTGPLVSPGISMTGGLNQAPIVTLASASTVNIGAAAANDLTISGTTAITAFDTVASGVQKRLTFSGALTLTHNSTSLILPYEASITTAAGDVATFLSLGSGNWRCVVYQRAGAAAVRNDLGLGSAAIAAVLGVVSQNNNSALMEQGSNANGAYYRYRNGLQICISPKLASNPVTNAFGSLYISTSISWTFPAAFAGDVTPMSYAQDPSETLWCCCSQGSYSSTNIATIYPASLGGSRPTYAFSIGKWY